MPNAKLLMDNQMINLEKTDSIINDCWQAIAKKEHSTLNTKYQPLRDIEKYLGLYPLQHLDIPSENKPEVDFSDIEPSFQNLNDDILYSLRIKISASEDAQSTDMWAEKILRFCEVRYRHLKNRCFDKCKSHKAAKLHIMHIAVFLMDQGFKRDDIRFVNTVLKIMDLKWAIDIDQIHQQLISANSTDLQTTLFQIRVLLTTELFLRRYQQENSVV